MIYKIPIKNQYFLDNFFFDFIEKIINKNDRKKFLVVYDLNDADYAIDSYRKEWNKPASFFNLFKTKFKKIHDLKIDGNVINSIYKGEN
jgi:hypothetical protein